ncbi:MAG: hypothetical protein K0B15_16230 [Lentimicrobium sp.]|nr:hypothetical protein [Lentimicrobium sp.]
MKNAKTLLRTISNFPGWGTKRKIVVFESDDWGSIRMASKRTFEELLSKSIPADKGHYNRYDSLESNTDLDSLFEVISSFKDKNNKHPVFTGVCVVANPDFIKIRENGFQKYFFEPFTETLKKYPDSDRVFDLWKTGKEKRLFVPQFHGREHLNVCSWLRDLRSGNAHTLLAFEHKVTGITSSLIPEGYQAAFDFEKPEELSFHKSALMEGLDLFSNLLGYTAEFFVPPNGPFNHSLMPVVAEKGVKYIMLDKWQKEPLGNGKFKNRFHYLGKKNRFGITYMSRNGSFEPSASNEDWVDKCLADIAFAFKMHKPAVISTHRVNYIGSLEPANRSRSLKLLKELLGRILKEWPDVEFITSVELGNLISTTKR